MFPSQCQRPSPPNKNGGRRVQHASPRVRLVVLLTAATNHAREAAVEAAAAVDAGIGLVRAERGGGDVALVLDGGGGATGERHVTDRTRLTVVLIEAPCVKLLDL